MHLLDQFLLVLPFTLYHIYIFSIIIYRLIRYKFWEKKDATINSVWIDMDYEFNELNEIITNKNIKIEYSYTVFQKRYLGSTLGVLDNFLAFTNYDDMVYNKLKNRFNNHKPITVFVSRRNPKRACCIRSIYSLKFLYLCLSGITFAGLTFWIYRKSPTLNFTVESALMNLFFLGLVIYERVKIVRKY